MEEASWMLRRLAAADTAGVVALYDRAMATEKDIGPVPAADWERFVGLPQNLGGRDFRVALAKGALAGLAESSPREHVGENARFFKIVVDPAWRRRGLGRALLCDLLSLDDDPQTELQTLVRPDWAAGVAFLSRFGLRVSEEEIGMRLDAPPRPGADGSPIVCERVGDLARAASALARLHNAAYAGDASHRPHSAADMAALLAEAEVWTAREGGEIVGFCAVEPDPASVWIENLAVDPSRQGQGVGATLLRGALRGQGVRADRPAALQVSSRNGAARRLYARLGFVERDRRARFSAPRRDILARL